MVGIGPPGGLSLLRGIRWVMLVGLPGASPPPVTGQNGRGVVHNSWMMLSWGCDMCTSKSYNRTQGARGMYISETRRSWEVGFVFFLCSEQYLVHFGDSAIIHLAQSVKVHPK